MPGTVSPWSLLQGPTRDTSPRMQNRTSSKTMRENYGGPIMMIWTIGKSRKTMITVDGVPSTGRGLLTKAYSYRFRKLSCALRASGTTVQPVRSRCDSVTECLWRGHIRLWFYR